MVINSIEASWRVLHPPREGWHTIINVKLLYFDLIYTVLQTGFYSLVLFLLLRQRRWGWILAVGAACCFLTTRIVQLDIGIRSPERIVRDWYGVLMPMVIMPFLRYRAMRVGTAGGRDTAARAAGSGDTAVEIAVRGDTLVAVQLRNGSLLPAAVVSGKNRSCRWSWTGCSLT